MVNINPPQSVSIRLKATFKPLLSQWHSISLAF
jgi:hypothetical protein